MPRKDEQTRIGIDEREATMQALGEHYAKQRITQEEWEDRTSQAQAAMFQSQLDKLLRDLPAVSLRTAVSRQQDRRPSMSDEARRALAGLLAVVVVMAGLFLIFLTVSGH